MAKAMGRTTQLESQLKVHLGPGVCLVHEPDSSRAEAVRQLRTQLVTRHFSLGRRALAICSPNAGGGSSFVAANLALALSQAGLSTALIDADLRRPILQTYFKLSVEPPALADLLKSTGPLASAELLVEALPNLTIAYGFGAVEDSDDLISSAMFTELIHFCMRNFDATLIDLPPANRYADARTAAAVAGYAIVVGRQDHTVISDIALLCRELKQDGVGVVGSVLVKG